MAALIARVHNAWLTLPDWFRIGLRGALVGGLLAVGELTFVVPSSLSEAKAQALTAAQVFGLAAWNVFRVAVLPRLITWFLGKTDLVRATKPAAWSAAVSDRWLKAA
jgi:hypothetical protein